MVLVNEQYRVTIKTEYRPSLAGYSVLYQAGDLNFDDFYTARFIGVEPVDGRAFQVAVLDFFASSAEPCAVLENDTITVILFRTILRIDLSTRTVARCVDRENMGGLEEIHPVDGGYLIKGESDIFRYNNDLDRIWHFYGRDIFAAPTGDKCFWIDGDVIHCRDWEGWHYILDMDGKTISEVLE